jgi:hypothetical protein
MWRISQRLLDHTLPLVHEIAIHFGGADETGQSRHYDFLILFIVFSFRSSLGGPVALWSDLGEGMRTHRAAGDVKAGTD